MKFHLPDAVLKSPDPCRTSTRFRAGRVRCRDAALQRRRCLAPDGRGKQGPEQPAQAFWRAVQEGVGCRRPPGLFFFSGKREVQCACISLFPCGAELTQPTVWARREGALPRTAPKSASAEMMKKFRILLQRTSSATTRMMQLEVALTVAARQFLG